jgi:hypothetical protein
MATTFIKSAFATTAVSKTRADIMELLERYGGTGFGYDAIGDEIIVRFTVPGAHGTPVRVAYPVNIDRVLKRLVPHFKKSNKGAPTREQAERVAWRNIYELVDAAFAAAAIGATTVEESFHAHIVIRTSDGAEGRMYDYVETLRVSAGGELPGASDIKRLLPGGR